MIRLGLGLGLGLTQQGVKALPPEPVIDGAMSLVIDTDLASGATIELPLSGTVDCTVYWGDWSTPTAATEAGDVSHTYSRPGTYTIQIDGDLTSFGDGATWTGADTLTSVTTFGDCGITALPGAFYGATNLTALPESVTGVTDISNMLNGATSYNGTELATWDITSLTDASNALDGCGLEPDHYNQIIMSWADQVATNSDLPASITLGADGLWWGNAEYDGYEHADVDTARSYLTTTAGWTIDGDTEAMVLVFDTSKEAGTTVELPLLGAIDCTVHWGDNTSNSYVEANSTTLKEHDWGTEGIYAAHVVGSVYRYGYHEVFGSIGYPGVKKLIQPRSFGNIGLISLEGAFATADNITLLPKSLPATITNLRYILTTAKVANKTCIENIELWNVANVGKNAWGLGNVGNSEIDLDLSTWTKFGQQTFQGPYVNPTLTLTEPVTGSFYMMFYNNTAYTKQFPLNHTVNGSLSSSLKGAANWNHSLENMLLGKSSMNMPNFLDNCGMSVENYSRTLIGLANYVKTNIDASDGGPIDVTLGAVGLQYDATEYGTGYFTDAISAKEYLTVTANWAITDAGVAE